MINGASGGRPASQLRRELAGNMHLAGFGPSPLKKNKQDEKICPSGYLEIPPMP